MFRFRREPHRPLLLTPVLTMAVVLSGSLAAPAAAQAPDQAPSHGAGSPASPAAANGEPVADPIPEEPAPSGTGLVVEKLVSFPRSEPTPPPTDRRLMRQARINHIGEVPDGSGRMFVPDLNGMLYLVEDREPHVYLDVKERFTPAFFSGRGLGQGFGFVTFHPQFADNGLFYTVHTEAASATDETPDLTPQPGTRYHGIVTEWRAEKPSADTFRGSHREVLRIGFGGQIHGIQQIDFNPTARPGHEDYGLLYVAVGDGGQGVRTDDPQDMAVPHGKILRIDPSGTDSANGQYGVPPGNPFAGEPGVLGEIYASGMRDPHRFSWDRTGQHRMFLGHIGEHAVEGVYEITPGANLGWSEREGPYVFDSSSPDPCDRIYPLPPDDAAYGYTYPVAAYDHDPPADWNCRSDVGRAISGGFVYRGRDIPELRGTYLFGDIVNGAVYATEEREMRTGGPRAPIRELMLYDEAGDRVTMRDLAGEGAVGDPNRVDLRFGQDAAGELYLIAKANGTIWKVTGTRSFADCTPGRSPGGNRQTNLMDAEDWSPVTPAKWRFPGREVVLEEPGTQRPGPRRPFEYAVLTAGPELGSLHFDGEVRIDTAVDVSNRDVVLLFGHRSDTEFYYAHLSSDNTIYPHNGIFVVDDADRRRIDDQWDGSAGAPPAISDREWHDVRLVHCARSGEIAVYVDGADHPVMTAVDSTFGSGRVGFGSFDNTGRLREVTVAGTGVS